MVEQKVKFQRQEAAPKHAEKMRMAATKCATDMKFPHLCSTKSIDVRQFKEQQAVLQQTELTTFRPDASSFKRNERQYEKAHELMKKKGESEV